MEAYLNCLHPAENSGGENVALEKITKCKNNKPSLKGRYPTNLLHFCSIHIHLHFEDREHTLFSIFFFIPKALTFYAEMCIIKSAVKYLAFLAAK